MTATIAYLDYNATAPIREAAAAAALDAMRIGGNPSSVHRLGRLARRAIDRSRRAVAALVGARPDEVVFTSGGTEANAMALGGFSGRRRIVSAIEHDSILAQPHEARIPVSADGVVDLAALEDLLEAPPQAAFVSVMLANNETGVIQPVADVVALAHARGALVHCDAVQAAGKMAIDFAALGVDLMSLSAHKIGGPQGVGALIVRDGLGLASGLVGGGQERGLRAGTENLAGIAGFGAAAEAARAEVGDWGRVAALRDDLEARLLAAQPDLPIFGRGAARLANTSCFAMPGVKSETQVIAFDLAGVAVSAGAACSSGKVSPSHVLRAMGAAADVSSAAIRISLGRGTAAAEIDRLMTVWAEVRRRAGNAAVAREPAA